VSRAEVRAAVATFFAPPNVVGLNKVFQAEPRLVQGQDFFAGVAAGTGYGAVGIVHIESERESRRAFGGATSGKKRIDYEVALIVKYRSDLVATTDINTIGAYDALIENIKTRLRSDRTLGSPTTIFQAGEGDTLGGPDIEILSDLPKKEGNIVHIWTAIRFKVVQFITS
jgi:hypothetical protein